MKMHIKIITSSNFPHKIDTSAMPKARVPAEKVPKARLNPLLSVAPTMDKAGLLKIKN